MADGKWIEGLRFDQPVEGAAAHVLEIRLEAVRQQLAIAHEQGWQDVESIHQLRVATRRADAAVRIFRPCLPRKVYRKARTELRSIRRVAGAARDWDVFLADLHVRMATTHPNHLPGLEFLLGYGLGQRHAAQEPLVLLGVHGTLSPGMFLRTVIGKLRTPKAEQPAYLGQLARKVIGELLGQLAQAASGDLIDYSHLHQVRIAGKKLRYAIEILGECVDKFYREELYPRVEAMQEILGKANDSHVAVNRLRTIRDSLTRWPREWQRLKPGMDSLLHFHQRRLPQMRRRFQQCWKEWLSIQSVNIDVSTTCP